MKISNGKVWYENISKEINNISQLDKKIYKGLFELIEHGAIFEIGPVQEYHQNMVMDYIVQIGLLSK